jgi:undecaprenyl-diphosphatase
LNELDRQILLALRSPGDLTDPVGPDWLQHAAVDLTALGSHTVLALLVLSAAGFLVLRRRRATALWLIMTTGSAMLLSHGLKSMFARARPELVDHLVIVVTPSFPSGHALLSAAVYPMLSAVMGRELARPILARYLMGLAVVIALMIGVSRVYLGVHWPSDVLAGWLAGSLCAWGGLHLARRASAAEGVVHGTA